MNNKKIRYTIVILIILVLILLLSKPIYRGLNKHKNEIPLTTEKEMENSDEITEAPSEKEIEEETTSSLSSNEEQKEENTSLETEKEQTKEQEQNIITPTPQKEENTSFETEKEQTKEQEHNIITPTPQKEEPQDKIYFLNTGTSDAIVLQSNGEYAMIDTGDVSSRDYVTSFLKKHNIEKLNFIIISHFHTDHYGGLTPIMSEFQVDKLYIKKYNGYDSGTDKGTDAADDYIVNYRETNKRRYNTYKELCNQKNTQFLEINDNNQNDAINQGVKFGNFKLSFYNRADCLKSFITNEGDYCLKSKNCSENINSIVIYGEIKNKKIYFSGDIENQKVYTDSTHAKLYKEKNVENEIALSVKNTKLYNGSIDLYKASHHGFINNNTGTAINYLQPKIAVVTNKVEKYNQYLSSDYPRKDTQTGKESYLKNLQRQVNSNIFVTGNGDVVVTISNDGSLNIGYDQ